MRNGLTVMLIAIFILICPFTSIQAFSETDKINNKDDSENINFSSSEFYGLRISELKYISNQEILAILSNDTYDNKKVIFIIIDTNNGNVKLRKDYDNVKNTVIYNDKIYILFENQVVELSTDLIEIKKSPLDMRVETASCITISNDGKYIAFVNVKNKQLCIYNVLTDKIIVKKECLSYPENLTFLTNTTIAYSLQGSWENYKTLDVCGTENEYKTANINFDIENKNGIAYSNYPEYSGADEDSIIKLLDEDKIVSENTGISNKGFFKLNENGQTIIALYYFDINKQDYSNFIVKLYNYDTFELVEQYKVNLIEQKFLVDKFDLSPDNKKLAIFGQLEIKIIDLIAIK